jgi:hypothetical protein
MTFTKYIKTQSFLHFQSVLWNETITKRFAVSYYDMFINNRNKQINTLFFGANFSKTIQNTLADTIGVDDETILKVYWEEFKVIRNELKSTLSNWCLQYIDDKKTKQKDLLYLLEKKQIPFDHNESIESIFYDFLVNDNHSKENYLCKICYENSIDCVILCNKASNNNACTICKECVLKLSNNICPFCNVPFVEFKCLVFH